jgi:histidinol-phosphate aminotransferase
VNLRPKARYDSVFRMLNPEGRRGKLRLDKNENVAGLPEELIQQALSGLTAESIAIYPEVQPLYKKLAESLNLDEANLMLAAGSDPAIKSLYELFVGEGDSVVLPKPTYAMFHVYARMFGATAINIQYGADLSLDQGAILDAISPDVQLVAIANPNSPTGTVVDEGFLRQVVEKAHSNGVVTLIDEAYYPFYSGTMLPYVNDYDNMVVTRTFSKAYGLAGLRLGYIAGSESLISLLKKVRPMYEVTGVAVHFGTFILDHTDVVDTYVAQVGEGKSYLATEMDKLGFATHPTHANFMHVRIPEESLRNAITEGLAAKDILITGRQGPPLEDCIRISLGPTEQMKRVAAGISEIVASTGTR